MLYSKIGTGVKGWQLGKITSILQVLTYLVKPLVELTPFPYLGQAYNLESLVNIINRRQD